MREILFRGKRDDLVEHKHDGEWIEGGVFKIGGKTLIMSAKDEMRRVYPETVGQFTGLTDKNGRRIFEGDIVGAKHPEQRKAVPCLVGFGEFEDVDSLDNYNYMGWFLKAYGKCLSILEPGKDEIDLEVIGNIHDNPELMGVAQ